MRGKTANEVKGIPMRGKTANEVKGIFKTIFSTYGVPKVVVSDNMPFNSYTLNEFAKEWGFELRTVSPNYPKAQRNGALNSEPSVPTIPKQMVWQKRQWA
ncbi:hypothetical protein QE152_g37161 [Popillia japonica]|uniref:Integrase catalytic domain-containing protein n=1 Tax=Popillia japonica TaxID=7064 RepID=A0AAW1IBG5_POPJA